MLDFSAKSAADSIDLPNHESFKNLQFRFSPAPDDR